MTYPKIRLKGDYKQTFATVDAFVDYRARRAKREPGFTLFASMCVQEENWAEIPEFLYFCSERNIQPILQAVIGREHLSLQKLSRQQLESVIAGIKPFLKTKERFTVLPVYEEVLRLLGSASVQEI